MKKLYFITVLSFSVCFINSDLSAAAPADTVRLVNKPGYMVVDGNLQKSDLRPRLIDWRPAGQNVRRFTFAVNPLYVIDNGMRFDFEHELSSNKSWMQYQLVVITGVGIAAVILYHTIIMTGGVRRYRVTGLTLSWAVSALAWRTNV